MKFSAKYKKKTNRHRQSEKEKGEERRGSDELVTKLRIKNTKKDEPDGKREWVSAEEG